MNIVEALRAKGMTVATCESLTAGLCAATIANIPGASAVLRGGLITYATDAKETLAGVPHETLAADGPVAASTAAFMAQGARERLGSDYGVALTGYAGPGGAEVGQVFIAVAGPFDAPKVREFQFVGGRQEIREQAVQQALLMLGTILAVGALE